MKNDWSMPKYRSRSETRGLPDPDPALGGCSSQNPALRNYPGCSEDVSRDRVRRTSPRPCLQRSRSLHLPADRSRKRGVSFQLPEAEASRGRLSALAQNLKRLTLAAAGAQATKPHKTCQRILRRPVLHVYLPGVSGLPTRRVPLHLVQSAHARTHPRYGRHFSVA